MNSYGPDFTYSHYAGLQKFKRQGHRSDNPPASGQVTTATALGENLLRRLTDAGISFSVIEETR